MNVNEAIDAKINTLLYEAGILKPHYPLPVPNWVKGSDDFRLRHEWLHYVVWHRHVTDLGGHGRAK